VPEQGLVCPYCIYRLFVSIFQHLLNSADRP
jgi:hypothetical protein